MKVRRGGTPRPARETRALPSISSSHSSSPAGLHQPLGVKLAPAQLVHRTHRDRFPFAGGAIFDRTLEHTRVETRLRHGIVRRIRYPTRVHEIVHADVGRVRLTGG